MFQTWFLKSVSVLFQRSIFNNFSFFDRPFRICLCRFVDRFTSFVEALLNIYEKKDFWMLRSWFPFCFHFVWLDAVGDWSQKKEQYLRNADLWSCESNVGHCAHSCRPLDDNKPFNKKWKEMTVIFICSKWSIGKYLNQNLVVSPICIYLSVCLSIAKIC